MGKERMSESRVAPPEVAEIPDVTAAPAVTPAPSNATSSNGTGPRTGGKRGGASKSASDPIATAAERVAAELDADVLFCNSDIDRPLDFDVINLCCGRQRRQNVMLILVTNGGDPDAAFRIARCLQSKYERFYFYITGYCKSAGTLIALGAHDLIFGNMGELGPLDVQMSKQDSLLETQSGLTVNAALTALQSKAYLAFEEFFLQTEHRSQGAITVKTAGDIALRLTTGLFAPLYAQVDPFHVGEAARAMQIADQYGRRLVEVGQNLDPESLSHLATHYPSHGFVIDRAEAETIFESVREPTEAETQLAEALGTLAYYPREGYRNKMLVYLNQPPVTDAKIAAEEPKSSVDPTPTGEDHDGESPTAVKNV
jgi:hypothetical protein